MTTRLLRFATRQHPAVRQLVRFCLVGLANTAVTLGIIFLLRSAGASVAVASAAGYVVGMIQGFLLNRFWTFAGVDHATSTALQVVGFVVVNAICGAAFVQLNVTVSRFLPLLLSSIVATGIVTPLSFGLNRWIVFRARP